METYKKISDNTDLSWTRIGTPQKLTDCWDALEEMNLLVQAKNENVYDFDGVLFGHASIIDKLQGIEDKVDAGNKKQNEEHFKILEHCKNTEILLKRVEADNVRLEKMLEEKYTIERMRVVAGSGLFACVLSLFASFLFQVNVIHPILSFIGILTSSFFLFMTYWRRHNAR